MTPDSTSPRPFLRWTLLTLPLTPLALWIYTLFEWLFLVTGNTPFAQFALRDQLVALAAAPVPFLLAALGIQAGFTAIALLAPRWRIVALVPAALVFGSLVLILLDNFTYTVFGFGIARGPKGARPAYLVLFLLFCALALRWLARTQARTQRLGLRPAILATAIGIGALAVVPVAIARVLDTPVWHREPAHAAATGQMQPNILIVTMDGVDAPFLSAYGYPHPTTPFLETLKDESLFFENAFSNVRQTHGSLVTLLTGRLPTRTHVIGFTTILEGEQARRHLPGLLKRRGYTTLQLGMRYFADADYANLVDAFDAANYRWERVLDRGENDTGGPGRLLRVAILERLEERVLHVLGLREMVDDYAHVIGARKSAYWADPRRVLTFRRFLTEASEPWFVHLHLNDTHCCDEEPVSRMFEEGSERERARQLDGIRDADDHLRAIVDALRETGSFERTVLVVTSDHTYGWGTVGRLPLLIRFPGRPAGVVTVNAQLADLAPTLLDYLDLEIPPWMDGESLLEWERIDPARPIFSIDRVTKMEDEVGPPNYGAAGGTVIVGNRAYTMEFAKGHFETEEIEGHTGSTLISEEEARRIVAEHFEEEGFIIFGWPPRKR